MRSRHFVIFGIMLLLSLSVLGLILYIALYLRPHVEPSTGVFPTPTITPTTFVAVTETPTATPTTEKATPTPSPTPPPRATIGMSVASFTQYYGNPIASSQRGLVLLYASADGHVETTSSMGIVVHILLTPYDGTTWATDTARRVAYSVLPADVVLSPDGASGTSAHLPGKVIHIQEAMTGSMVSAISVSLSG